MLQKEIAPGVRLTSLPGEKFKRNLITLHLLVPGRRETANELALLPHLLERRCEAIPSPLALSRKLFDLYGAELATDSYTAGANRVVSLAVSCLKNQYALAGEDLVGECAELLFSLLFAPVLENGAFAEEDLAIERDKQVDYLRSEMNDKRSYCLRQGRRALLGHSPLGIESAGYLDEMPGVTAQSLYAAYKGLLENAQMELVVCGADAGRLEERLARRLANVNRAPMPTESRMVAPRPEAFSHKSEAMDTAQGKLCILLCSGEVPDARGEAVMRVASALLGGLPTSRLFMNVREKQSLCYYCSSSYNALQGVLTLDSGVDHKDARRAADAMLHELKTLQNAPVTPDELAAAHSALQNAFRAAKDSPDSLVSWVFGQQLRGSGLSLDQEMELIASVKADEVQKALAAFTPAVEYVITGKEGA